MPESYFPAVQVSDLLSASFWVIAPFIIQAKQNICWNNRQPCFVLIPWDCPHHTTSKCVTSSKEKCLKTNLTPHLVCLSWSEQVFLIHAYCHAGLPFSLSLPLISVFDAFSGATTVQWCVSYFSSATVTELRAQPCKGCCHQHNLRRFITDVINVSFRAPPPVFTAPPACMCMCVSVHVRVHVCFCVCNNGH